MRFLARSKRGTRSMPAWLFVATRQRSRRFCASGWEETKEGAAVWWRSPDDRTGLGFPDRCQLRDCVVSDPLLKQGALPLTLAGGDFWGRLTRSVFRPKPRLAERRRC